MLTGNTQPARRTAEVQQRPVVELRQVTKYYGARRAVEGVDLAVLSGELLALLGSSGGGKTTLIRLIAGFTPPTSGRIFLGGRDVTGQPAYRRDVGVVFQHYALFPHMTVEDNIAFGLKVRHRGRAEIGRRVREMLSLVRLTGYERAYPRQLSGGQQQRVALARALAIDPEVLLLDEPLSNLDANLRRDVGEEIRRLQRATRTTAILVTHDHHEAFGMADRVAVLQDGAVAQVGTPWEIYRRPRNRFVARFVGPANFIPGRVRVSGNSVAEVEAPGGARILAAAAPGLSGDVEVMVRPEDVRILPDGGEADNTFTMEVDEAFYYGDFASVRLASGQFCLTATVRGPEVERIRAGARVRVGWDAMSAYPLEVDHR